MTWHYRRTEVEGRTAGLLLDDRFAASPPSDSLQHLGWFGVYCRRNPGASFWDPEEASTLDRIEDDLIHLCGQWGKGWAVYLRRLDTPGIREYYVYFGAGAELDRVLPSLQALHPEYRLEYDTASDPDWDHYRSWLSHL